MKAGTAIDASVSDDPRRSRESGIMDIVDREPAETEAISAKRISAAKGADRIAIESDGDAQRDEIDINTDDTPEPPVVASRSVTASSVTASSVTASSIAASGTATSSSAESSAPKSSSTLLVPPSVTVRSSVTEDGTIEVMDDEIEEADPS